MENGGNIHLNILFVPSLHKNLLSISSLEDKGGRVAFIDGRVVVWGKNSSIEDARMIGIREGRLYILITPSLKIWFTLKLAHVNFGIEYLIISTTKFYQH